MRGMQKTERMTFSLCMSIYTVVNSTLKEKKLAVAIKQDDTDWYFAIKLSFMSFFSESDSGSDISGATNRETIEWNKR